MSSAATPATLHALAADCIASARKQRLHMATAESCTGGRVADLLTNVPGASEVYLGGWVAYHNDRKVADLGVDPALLESEGAVSAVVAAALAEGARHRAGADIAIATTGITGPSGGSEAKPVGTLWLAVAGPGTTRTERLLAEGKDRDANKSLFAEAALRLLASALTGQADP